jgi:hypothetical protein
MVDQEHDDGHGAAELRRGPIGVPALRGPLAAAALPERQTAVMPAN